MKLIGFSAVLLALCLCAPVTAHHSATAFDRTQPYTLMGTIKKFEWVNPHVWITVTVPNGQGGGDDYRLEGPGTAGLMRKGWNAKTYQVGDQAKFLVAPYRDGSKRGEFMAAWKADGTQLEF